MKLRIAKKIMMSFWDRGYSKHMQAMSVVRKGLRRNSRLLRGCEYLEPEDSDPDRRCEILPAETVRLLRDCRRKSLKTEADRSYFERKRAEWMNDPEFAELYRKESERLTIRDLVANHFQDWDKALLWMETSNPLLGDITPNQMLERGRFEALHKFVVDAIDGI